MPGVKKITVLSVALVAAALLSSPAPAATTANAKSPLGVNLNYLAYYDPEQPFLNIFKTTPITQSNPSGWSTRDSNMSATKEESYLQLDSSGFPTTLTASSADPNSPQKFTQVCALLENALPSSNAGAGAPYRSGQYVVLYDGAGSLSVSMDASLVSASAGRDVINVAKPSSNGFWLCITSTNAANHLRNIRVVKAEEESLLDAGNIYTPAFLNMLASFRVIRAMQWLKIDDNPGPSGNWADRSQIADAGWGSENGVPFEAVISLCNALGADCWLNVPASADGNYITQLATLVHQQLGSSQSVYIEFSNEVWNAIYPQFHQAISAGLQAFAGNTNQLVANRDWYGEQTAQMCDIWANVWGADYSRVHCVLGAQGSYPYTATEALNCPQWSQAPCYKHHITDVAIAPYFSIFSNSVPTTWPSLDPGTLVSDIFAEINSGGQISNGYAGGLLKEDSDWEAAYEKLLAPYGLSLITYEGGQSLVGNPTYAAGSTVVKGFIAANRDQRMGAAYTRALSDWKANGGHLYVLYDDVYGVGTFGEWGALESVWDTQTPLSSAPPKWQAIQSFITNNPCWWSECTGTIVGNVPSAPNDFKAAMN